MLQYHWKCSVAEAQSSSRVLVFVGWCMSTVACACRSCVLITFSVSGQLSMLKYWHHWPKSMVEICLGCWDSFYPQLASSCFYEINLDSSISHRTSFRQTMCALFWPIGPHRGSADTRTDTWKQQALYHPWLTLAEHVQTFCHTRVLKPSKQVATFM